MQCPYCDGFELAASDHDTEVLECEGCGFMAQDTEFEDDERDDEDDEDDTL